MRLHFVCSVIIILLNGEGGLTTSVIPEQQRGGERIMSTGSDGSEQEYYCWEFGCLYTFAKFYNTILLGDTNYQWGIMEYRRYLYALQYFAYSYIPISSIRRAFETCISYERTTSESCLQLFSTFRRQGYTINFIADYCSRNRDVCKDPESKLIKYNQDQSLQSIDNLDISTCLPEVSVENQNILFDNLRLAYLMKMALLNNERTRNKCSCHQVHFFGDMVRVFDKYAVFTESSAPPAFDDLLTALCIDDAELIIGLNDKFLWPDHIVKDITAKLGERESFIRDRVELAKQILLKEFVISPAVIDTHRGWTILYIIDEIISFHIDPEDYKMAIDLIGTAMSYLRERNEYITFMTQTFALFTEAYKKFEFGYRRERTLIYSKQMLVFRHQFMNIYANSNETVRTMIMNCRFDTSYTAILDFYKDYYYPVAT